MRPLEDLNTGAHKTMTENFISTSTGEIITQEAIRAKYEKILTDKEKQAQPFNDFIKACLTENGGDLEPILGGKKIPVNNGRQVLITLTPGGLLFRAINDKGQPESELTIDDGEIIAAYNLLQYMKSHRIKRAYIPETDDTDSPAGFIDFPIFQ